MRQVHTFNELINGIFNAANIIIYNKNKSHTYHFFLKILGMHVIFNFLWWIA